MQQLDEIQRFLDREKGLKSESSYLNKKYTIDGFRDWMDSVGIDSLAEVTPDDIEDYFIHMSNDGYSPKTVDIRYTALKNTYEYLEDRTDIVDESPFDAVDRSDFNRVFRGTKKEIETREEITYITADEVDEIVNHLSTPALRNELMVRLMFQTGIREVEANDLRIEDVDRDSRAIKIRSEKVDKNRTVFYQPNLDFLLQQWIEGGYRDSYSCAEDSPYLLITRSGRMSRGRNSRIIKEAAQDAGINEVMYVDQNGLKRWKITGHTLRHSHAVHALKSGIDVRSVQKHLGHASLEQTMNYLRVVEDDVQREYQKFG